MSTRVAYLADGSGTSIGVLLLVKGQAKTWPDLPLLQILPRKKGRAIQARVIPGNQIRSARVAAGLTQAELAPVMGVSQPMLSRFEQTARALRTETIRRAQEAIEAIQEYKKRVKALSAPTEAEVERALEPLTLLGRKRKRRDPQERALLIRSGDPLVLLETEGRIKVAGARAERPRALGRKR